MPSRVLPPGVITFGSDSTCSLHTCPIEWSIYGYRPSLAANITFLSLFAVAGIAHLYLGFRFRSWAFTAGMLLGCMTEIIGYVGRVLMWYNPFSFNGFMVQIVCLTIAPVFFTASLYLNLQKAIVYLAPDLSRGKPELFYWIFIPFDLLCLVLQALGGGMSTNSTGSNQTGVNISMAGLVLQVIVLTSFIVASADYMVRYLLSGRSSGLGIRLKAFFIGLTLSSLLILARCAYRVAELKDGYDGKLIEEEVPFIVMEGALMVISVTAMLFGHPNYALNAPERGEKTASTSVSDC